MEDDILDLCLCTHVPHTVNLIPTPISMFLGLQPSAQSLGFEQALQALLSASLCLRCFLSRGGKGGTSPCSQSMKPALGFQFCLVTSTLGYWSVLSPWRLLALCPGKDRALHADLWGQFQYHKWLSQPGTWIHSVEVNITWSLSHGSLDLKLMVIRRKGLTIYFNGSKVSRSPGQSHTFCPRLWACDGQR